MSSLSNIEILRLFKENILKFFDSIIELFPERTDLISLRVLMESYIPIDQAIQIIKNRLVPNREEISKNDEFLLQSIDIFRGLENTQVIEWKSIWQSKRLDNEDKNAIRKWLYLFMDLAEMYEVNNN